MNGAAASRRGAGANRAVVLAAACAVSALTIAARSVPAQPTGSAPSTTQPDAPEGAPIPDLSGTWFPDYCIPDGATCPFDIDALELTPRAIEFMNDFDEAISPKYDCVPATIPSIVADPYAWQIRQRSNRVEFRYEKDDVVRIVWVDGRRHPPPGEREVEGHSIGWYEGDTLVVETTNFPYDPIGLDDMTPLPTSTRKTVTERYRREGDRLLLDMTVEDELYLAAPAEAHFEWALTDIELLPYECDLETARQPLRFLPD